MNDLVIEIVRYANRKLYCKNLGRYVNLAEIADMIQSGKEVDVICMVTKKDYLTPIMATYLKMIYEEAVLKMSKREVIEEIKKKITKTPQKYLLAQKTSKEFHEKKTQSLKEKKKNTLENQICSAG